MTDPAIGTVVNGYRIVGRLGEGGMGVVYEALEPDIGKRVAIKVMKHELAEDPTFITRLLDEARAVNAIRHRGIVDIFGAGSLLDGRKCILMEHLDGVTLDAEIRLAAQSNRTIPLMRVLTICDEVLNALDAAHLASIVHRDLKPSNIFLCRQPNGEQHVKLLDFGIAKVAASGSTHSSGVVGTPLYMAPEQAIADRLTSAVDLYAFGVILFELLTGRVPFSSESVARVMFHHLHTPPPLPSESNPTIPAALDRLVTALLAKEPSARPVAADARRELARVRVALSDPTAMPTLDEAVEPSGRPQTLAYASGVDQSAAVSDSVPVVLSETLPTAASGGKTAVVPPPAPLAETKPLPIEGPLVAQSNVDQLEVPVAKPSTSHTLSLIAGVALVALLLGGGWYASRTRTPEPVPQVAPAVAKPEQTQPAKPEVAPPVAKPELGQAASPEVAKPEPPPSITNARPSTEPPPKAVVAAKPTSGLDRRIEARLERLEAAVRRATARGDDMELTERQLRQLRTGFATAKTQHEREALEVALTRIEEELKE